MENALNNIAVLINLNANGGSAKDKWSKIKEEFIATQPGPVQITTYMLPFDMRHYIRENVSKIHIRQFIIGGGDGTINLFLNELAAIVGIEDLKNYTIGAIALGSSNDFTKPVSNRMSQIPMKVNTRDCTAADIGLVKIYNADGYATSRLFIVNAGVGVIAQANHQYNHPDTIISYLKRKLTSLSIIYTAVKTIVKFRNIPLELDFIRQKRRLRVSNLSVTLSPFISGSLHYKLKRQDDGFFNIFICSEMGKMNLLLTLIQLSSGKFKPGNRRIIHKSECITVKSEKIIPIETDGEIAMGTQFDFSIIKQGINLMH